MTLPEEINNKLIGAIDGHPGLNNEDKKDWKERVNLMSPSFAIFLLDLFENSPQDIDWLVRNIQEKKKILENKDKEGWRDLLAKEKDFLEKLAGE